MGVGEPRLGAGPLDAMVEREDRVGRDRRTRFWIEAGLAVLSGCLFIVTLIWRDWIEILFGVDLDNSSGALEWLIVAAALSATVFLAALASFEWRRHPSRA